MVKYPMVYANLALVPSSHLIVLLEWMLQLVLALKINNLLVESRG